MPKKATTKSQPNYVIHKYTVVRFDDEFEVEKLFECIPDRWFLDETKSRCYWPPSTGTPFSLRAIRCEKPDDSWNVYEVKVISEGHSTYNSGFKIVLEKCNQKYNTSSAEEQIDAANYRRKHPVLAMQNEGSGSIEHVFAKPNETSKKGMGKQDKASFSSKKPNTTEVSSTQISNNSISISNFHLSHPNLGEGSSTDAVIHNFGDKSNERGETETDLSLDHANNNLNDMSNDDQNEGTNTPKATSNGSPSNLSRSSNHHSTHALSDRSRSIVSVSGESRSNSNKSRSRKSGSNISTSSRSRSDSSSQSQPDTIKSRKRQSRFQSRSPSKKRLNRYRSTSSNYSGSSRSIDDSQRSLTRKPVIKKSASKSTSKSDTNNRNTLFVNPNGNVNNSNERRKNSEVKRQSNFHSSRSRSIQSISSSSNRSHSSGPHSKPNRHCSSSRSRTASSTVRKKTNHSEELYQLHGDILQNRAQKTSKSRRSLEGNENAKSKFRNHSERKRIGTQGSRSSHRRSSSDFSRNRSRCSISPGYNRKLSKHEKTNETSRKSDSIADLMNVVRKLTGTINKNNQQLKDYDRPTFAPNGINY